LLALQVVEAGHADLRDVPDPEPAGGDVVVELELATLNPIDDQVVGGLVGPAEYPRTLGIEGLGRTGDARVLVFGHGVGVVRDGTLAERVAVPRAATYPVPDGLQPEQAVACGAVGSTAMRLVTLAAATEDDRVLVLGGSGSCGAALTSYMTRRGARVIGQTSSPAKAAVVEAAGGKPIIAEDPAALVSALRDEPPTVVVDALGAQWTAAAIDLLAPRGRLVLYATAAGEQANLDLRTLYRKSITIRGYSGLSELPDVLDKAVTSALQSASRGHFEIPVAESISLVDAPREFERGVGRRGGKVIVEVRQTG
jgi:NADPH2:quinone reductase